MKTIFKLSIIACIILASNACKSNAISKNSQNSYKYIGIYNSFYKEQNGIEKIITLSLDSSFTYNMQTIASKAPNNPINSSGTFVWNKSENEIILKDKNTGDKTIFTMNETMLTEKDKSLILKKINPTDITNKYWKLTEIKGKSVVKSDKMVREAHLILRNDLTFSGSGGCNLINGVYEIDKRQVKFSKVIGTRMACMDMEIENSFLEALQNVDNYSISIDGNTLLLSQATIPLARFEVVYLR